MSFYDAFHQYVDEGKQETRKTIISDFVSKTIRVENLLSLQGLKGQKTSLLDIGKSSILTTSSSIQNNPPSIMDDFDSDADPYYTRSHAPLFERPQWRLRRPMIAQNKWRRRPSNQDQIHVHVHVGSQQHVYW